jgi:hypothetical protein
VPDYSSLLGNPKEQAETLQANHMGMCRFYGPGDLNYCKVSDELRGMYRSISHIDNPGTQRQRLDGRGPDPPGLDETSAYRHPRSEDCH